MWLTQVLLLLAPADDFNDSFNNNSTDNNMNNNNIINNNNDLEYTLTSSTDTHSDSVVQQASASPLSSLLPLSSLSSLFVLAVLAMAVLQVKLFLQSVHLMGSLSLSLGPSSWARHSSGTPSLPTTHTYIHPDTHPHIHTHAHSYIPSHTPSAHPLTVSVAPHLPHLTPCNDN